MVKSWRRAGLEVEAGAGDMGRGMPEAPRLTGRGRVRFPDSAGDTQRDPGAGDGDLHLCTA